MTSILTDSVKNIQPSLKPKLGRNLFWIFIFAFALFGTSTFAHEGITNHSGCHSDGSGYHCHPQYGQNTYPNYRCNTNFYNGYSRYGYNDSRSLSYSCRGGNGYNSYNNYRGYNSRRNYQTYYGTQTYHNYDRYQNHKNYRYQINNYQRSYSQSKYYDPNYNYGKNLYKARIPYNPQRAYQNQYISRDTSNRYYNVPKQYGATLRNYKQWPYTR